MSIFGTVFTVLITLAGIAALVSFGLWLAYLRAKGASR